jgi:hypothetical protein
VKPSASQTANPTEANTQHNFSVRRLIRIIT